MNRDVRDSAADGGQPLVSVLIPTIGRTDYLKETLACVDVQTYPHLEVLILENASPPEARHLLEEYCERNPRARVLRSDERLAMFANFNRGIRAARGHFIIFFHDDDVYLPDCIEREVKALQMMPTASFVGSNCYVIDHTGQVTGTRNFIRETRLIPGRRYTRSLMARGLGIMPTQGIMYRHSALLQHDFDENLSVHWGDFIMQMRMAETADVAVLSDPLWQMRVHAGSTSSSIALSKAVPLRSHLMREYCTEFAARWPDQQPFVADLKRKIQRSHRFGLLWGWVIAPDHAEAEACLGALDETPLDRGLRYLCRRAEYPRSILRTRHSSFIPLLRRIAESLSL